MKLKFFSLTRIIEDTKTTATRFPLAMLTAFLGTIISLVLLHIEGLSCDSSDILTKVLMILIIAFPLAIVIVLFGEQQQWKEKEQMMANIAVILFLIAYYLLIPVNFFEIEKIFLMRYFMWIIAFVIVISFIPFLQKEKAKINIFWQYNCDIISSLALTILYALSIQIGLAIALSSIDFLFNIKIDYKRYMELWIIVVGIFSTTFFLSRIPKNISQREETDFYPRELRLFSQYVLVPLVTMYFIILYAYVAKILITWDWPESVLAYMILGFSFLGILTYIILYPQREKVEWIKKAGRIFYLILIPQVGMLFWALWFRIAQYGITEKRYFVFIFGLWLLGIGIYFLRGKKKDIRLIPITISVIILICSFGPWGAFAVSKKNQIGRLEKILIKNHILINNKIQKSEKEVTFDDRKEISAIIRYLIDVHGVDSIQSWFNQDLSLFKEEKEVKCGRRGISSYALPPKIVKEFLGLNYVNQWDIKRHTRKDFYLYTVQSSEEILDISEYDYMVMIKKSSGEIGELNGDNYRFELESNKKEFIIFKNDVILTRISMQEFWKNIVKQYFQEGKSSFSRDEMKAVYKDKKIKLALYLTYISSKRQKDGSYNIKNMSGQLLFSL